MQISHRSKFIFFSFPKTGSESVRQLLEPFSDIHGIPYWERNEDTPFYSHISPAEVKLLFEKNGWDYDDYYKFTFVRNPWARMVSLYNMIYFTKPATSLIGKLRSKLRNTTTPGFKQWLLSTKTDGEGAGGPPDQRWQVYGSYSIEKYIMGKENVSLVDQVIKLEEIDDALPLLLNKLGLPNAESLHIPRINTRKRQNYADYYDEESREIIAKRYHYDIEQFNYAYEDII